MEFVAITVQNNIGEIKLNRPEKRNALNAQFVVELRNAFKLLEEDKECKVVVIKATGNAFCAGADLAYLQELQTNTFDENLEDSRNLMYLFKQIYTFPKIVIAQIEGHAIAGGSGLATVCDFAYSIPEAKFGYTEVKIGFIPALVSVILLRKIGESNANKLLLTGSLIGAETAKKMGMITDICDAGTIDKHVREQALALVDSVSQESVKRTKEMIKKVQVMELDEAMEFAAEQNALSRETEDCKKGIAAFLNIDKKK